MDLKALYQDMIVEHSRHPRNFGKLDQPTHTMEGFNPLCGDRLTLYLNVHDDHVDEARFEGSGCAISMASASLMTESIKGRTIEEAETLYHSVHGMITGSTPVEDRGDVGKLQVLEGVKDYPSRVKCAGLCWHALHGALSEPEQDHVTTE